MTQGEESELGQEIIEADELCDKEFVWKEKAVKVNCERPVMIHRAIFGSLERFMAILAENYAGKWPFWISPRQAKLVPVAAAHVSYCKEVAAKLREQGW